MAKLLKAPDADWANPGSNPVGDKTVHKKSSVHVGLGILTDLNDFFLVILPSAGGRAV